MREKNNKKLINIKEEVNIPRHNNLLELFFRQFEIESTEFNLYGKKNILLSSLKDPKNQFSWSKTFFSIKKLLKKLRNIQIKVIDVC